MLQRIPPVERSPTNRSTTSTAVSGRRTGAQLEEITFESHSLKLVDTVDVRIGGPASRRWSLAAKRAFDVVASFIGLIVVAPALAVLAALICLESPGPPLFRHERIGLGGRRFGCLKLRTMRPDAEEQLRANPALYDEYRQHHFKIPEDRDPRTTRLGRWLRRSSLDELPQLWNVLVGDMSLVGPRPFFEADLESYEDHHFRRLDAKPGITGLWQVNGRSDVVDFEEVVRYDREYIEHWSLLLDFTIMAKTVPVLFRRTGAY